MKKLILLSVLIVFAMGLKAQEIFFPTKEGTVLIYKSFDKKNKETGSVRYTIENINRNGNDMDITYLIESIDQKDELTFKEEITIHMIDDVLYCDMSNFVNKAAFQQDGEIPSDIQITGNNLEIPSHPKPGDILPDALIEMAMKMGYVSMKMTANVTNRKVEALEDITVLAGSFNTYRFSSEVSSTILGLKTFSKTIDWYAKGIGVIRTENYDKKGAIQSRMELVEIR
ncbi:MAG: hypothetical protein K9H49_04185 [Bacteroidales bacterium]|nr:hypothetical protein [Bacteroidales bacterium]MCF8390026.1 hypothetical protein [Bacteroidales bacterium]